jgi:hypothetical protein
MGRWLLLSPDGAREQVMTGRGAAPGLPEGWRAIKVSRFGDLARERFDERARRWGRCPALCAEAAERQRLVAEAWLERLPPGVLDLICERVAERLERRSGEGVGK